MVKFVTRHREKGGLIKGISYVLYGVKVAA